MGLYLDDVQLLVDLDLDRNLQAVTAEIQQIFAEFMRGSISKQPEMTSSSFSPSF